MLLAAFFLYFIPAPAFGVVNTIVGYAIPNSNGLQRGLVPFILPIIVTALFAMLARFMRLPGETNTLIIRVALLVGCLLGMLSLTSSAPTLIPVGFPVVAGVYLITYLWKRV